MNDMSRPPAPRAVHFSAGSSDAADPLVRMNERLMEQAQTLDDLFVGLAGHAADQMTEWPAFAQIYVRLALRAQANYRASVATLIKAADLETRRAQDASAAE